MGEDILFQKLNDDIFIGFLGGDGIHPFSEVVHGCEDPSVLATRVGMDLTNEVQPPLLERVLYSDWLKG